MFACRYDPTMSSGTAASLPEGLTARDEGRHRAADDMAANWEESWHFDFISSDGEVGASLRLGRQPDRGLAPVWGCLVRAGHPLVHLVDHDVPLVRETDSIGARGEGIWVDAVCETPFDHWSVGLEAFAVALDDPEEASGRGRGDRIGLGFDLEWETDSEIRTFELSGAKGYQMMCRVHGEVLIGSEALAIDGWGGRQHVWGLPPWSGQAWCWGGGVLDDGTTWQLSPDGTARLGERTALIADLSLMPQSLRMGDTELDLAPHHRAPVLLPSSRPMPSVLLERRLVVVTVADRSGGTAWLEWSEPPSS